MLKLCQFRSAIKHLIYPQSHTLTHTQYLLLVGKLFPKFKTWGLTAITPQLTCITAIFHVTFLSDNIITFSSFSISLLRNLPLHMSLDWAPEPMTTVCVVLYLSSLQLVLNHDQFLFTAFQPGLEPLIRGQCLFIHLQNMHTLVRISKALIYFFLVLFMPFFFVCRLCDVFHQLCKTPQWGAFTEKHLLNNVNTLAVSLAPFLNIFFITPANQQQSRTSAFELHHLPFYSHCLSLLLPFSSQTICSPSVRSTTLRGLWFCHWRHQVSQRSSTWGHKRGRLLSLALLQVIY